LSQTSATTEDLRAVARWVRREVIKAVHVAKGGHIGGPLSVTEILVALYFNVMNVDPARPDMPDRDRLVLSKGHSSIALYAVLARRGFFPPEELYTFDAIDSRLQGHPDMTVTPGVDMSTGSLGQGLSTGAGMALGARMSARPFHTFVVLGDGECQEGQVWEAAMFAAENGLSNLTAIVDVNGLPQWGLARGPHEPVPLLREKWQAFGWDVREVDGHDLDALTRELTAAKASAERPTCLLARTVKGKGVSFMEGDFNWHSRVPTDAELSAALRELGGEEA